MFRKILKIGGLVLLATGGIAMLVIPGVGWVTGGTAIIVAAVGAGALVSSMWGAHQYMQHEQNIKLEEELRHIKTDIANMEMQNEEIQYEKFSLTQQLTSTANVKSELEKLILNKDASSELQEMRIDQLQNQLQTNDRKYDELQLLLEEHGIDTSAADVSPISRHKNK